MIETIAKSDGLVTSVQVEDVATVFNKPADTNFFRAVGVVTASAGVVIGFMGVAMGRVICSGCIIGGLIRRGIPPSLESKLASIATASVIILIELLWCCNIVYTHASV